MQPSAGEMEGWLKKKTPKAQGSKMLESWQKRYFVLGGGELKYFKTEKAASLSNAESLKAIPISQIFGASTNPKHSDTFMLDLGNDRKVKLQAGSEHERDQWVTAIEAAKRRGESSAHPPPHMDSSPFQQPQRAGAVATPERVRSELLQVSVPSKQHGCCLIS